jgi:hypothetical protein
LTQFPIPIHVAAYVRIVSTGKDVVQGVEQQADGKYVKVGLSQWLAVRTRVVNAVLDVRRDYSF